MDYLSKSIFSANDRLLPYVLVQLFLPTGFSTAKHPLRIRQFQNEHRMMQKCCRHFGSHPHPLATCHQPKASQLVLSIKKYFLIRFERFLTPALSGFLNPALLQRAPSSPFGLLNVSARLDVPAVFTVPINGPFLRPFGLDTEVVGCCLPAFLGVSIL